MAWRGKDKLKTLCFMYKINSKIEDSFTSDTVKEIFKYLGKFVSRDDLSKVEVGYSPDNIDGDFSLSCFFLSKKLKKSPANIAKDLSGKIELRKNSIIKFVKNDGPYLNFFVDNSKMSEIILTDIFTKKNKIGSSSVSKKKTVLIEYVSPNTNKPLHLGHGRNAFLGWSISRILKENGYKVVKACLINDRGVHISKSMIAYLEKGSGKTPKKTKIKSDHFVGDYYVLFDELSKKDPDLELRAKEMLKKWESGDSRVLSLWRKMNKWAQDGINETFNKIGIKFDKFYFESDIYKEGRGIVLKGLRDKKFIEKDGAIIADLSKYNLPDKVLLRSDGTALYITQDLYLTYLKYRNYKPSNIIHIIGSEQNLYQKQLFAVLDILGFKRSKSLNHLGYGMVNVDGGKLKSREGVKVDIDNLIDDLIKMAQKEVSSRNKTIGKKEAKRRSEIIALGALKYYILQYGPKAIVNFSPKESLSFTGKTGPYLQYSYARISGIIKKSGVKISKNVDFSVLDGSEEKKLISQLSRFPEVVNLSGKNLDPSILAKYLFELAKSFNAFYHAFPVLDTGKEIKKARLLLIFSVSVVIKKGLDLLGIDVLDEM